MPKVITAIPATKSKFTSAVLNKTEKRKVCAYARVSTDHEEQQTSYEAQVDYYTNYIKSRDDWQFVDVYADEGISGTSTKNREAFNKMINDALDKKIELIITKSVSRFARNTVDSLTIIRKLKENGVEVYFEKENIYTFDSKGELLLTIMSSLAQEESRSISENVTWGHRKRAQDGKMSCAYSRFLGYDKGPNGELVINQEQAKIVRKIFGLYLQGYASPMIAKILTEEGIPTMYGNSVWRPKVILDVLQNEKYKGDALLQKTFTVDFLTHKHKKNRGEVPQYYVANSHEPIIEPDIFDSVQAIIKSKSLGRLGSTSAFSGKIKCSCGTIYSRFVWHSNDTRRANVWRCQNKYDGVKCTTPHFYEYEIQDMFIDAMNKMLVEREQIIATFENLTTLFDISNEMNEKVALQEELEIVGTLADTLIEENKTNLQNQDEYERKYNELARRYGILVDKIAVVDEKINEIQGKKEMAKNFINAVKEMPYLVTMFDEKMWYSMIDFVQVENDNKVTFNFKNGNKVTIPYATRKWHKSKRE